MVKIRNHRIYSDDQEFLLRLADDYEFLGRRYRLERGQLTVFALQTRRKRAKKDKDRTERNKRAEKTYRSKKVDTTTST